MKRIALGLLLVILLAACSQANPTKDVNLDAQANSWQKVGGALDFTVAKDAANPQLVLDRQGNLVAAWAENNNGWKLYLERWTSMGWQSFGVGFPMAASSFSVAFDSNNKVVASIYTPDFKVAIHRREAAGVWTRLGSPFTGTNDISTDKNGAIYSVLFNEQTGTNFIRRWNGSSWQTTYTFQRKYIDAGEPVYAKVSVPKFKSDGIPVVSWADLQSRGKATNFSVWNGKSWDDVYFFRRGSYTLDRNDKFVAAGILGSASPFGIALARNDQQLGGPLETTTGFVSVTVDGLNRPILAYTEAGSSATDNNLVVSRWTGNTWSKLGVTIDRIVSRDVNSGRVLVDKAGTLYAIWRECVAFSTSCTNHNIYVSKYVP